MTGDTGMLDDPGTKVKIEVAMVIVGESETQELAYSDVHTLQSRIDRLLREEFFNLNVTVSQATYGDEGNAKDR